MPTTTPDPNGCPRCGRIDCPSLRDFCPPPECQLDPVDWRALYFAAALAAPLDQVRDPRDWHDFDGVCPECHSTMPGFHRANCAERQIEATVAAPAVRVEGVLEALRMDRTILEVHVASGEHGLDPGSRVAVTPLPDPHKGDRQG